MTYDPDEKWWLDDSHPDASSHRRWLAEQEKKEAARRRPPPPPSIDPEALGAEMRALVEERLRPIEDKLAELDARPTGLSYDGVWRPGKSYARNTGVSHKGSTWVAVRDFPDNEPGVVSSGWQLCAKRGRDGKDAAR
jgi:hypothetical protein